MSLGTALPMRETDAPRTTAKPRYYPALDGVRAVAALLVLAFHGSQEGLRLPMWVNFGQTGVDLFFVLSGFLITSILLASRTGEWSEVRLFYARRSFRIFPLYYLNLVVCSLFFFPCSWPFWVYLQNIWSSMGWTISGPPHLWSLAVEEQFYLIWPFVILFAPRRWLLPGLWAVIAGSFLLRLALAGVHRDVYALTFTRLDSLSSGAVLAVLLSRGLLHRWRAFLLSLGPVGFLSTLVLGVVFQGRQNIWFAAGKYSLLAAMYAGIVGWLVLSPEHRVSRWLSVRPLRQMGRVSYGLYIWHPYVFTFTFRALEHHSVLLKGSAALVGSILLAHVSFYGFEQPFLRLKERLTPSPEFGPRAPLRV